MRKSQFDLSPCSNGNTMIGKTQNQKPEENKTRKTSRLGNEISHFLFTIKLKSGQETKQ